MGLVDHFWLVLVSADSRPIAQVIRAFSGHFKGHPLVSLDAMGGEGEGAAGVRILARKDIAAGTVVLVDCPLLTIAVRRRSRRRRRSIWRLR